MPINEAVLVDTGPLVACMYAKDKEHETCLRIFDELTAEQLFVCWPVLTEAAYLASARGGVSPAETLKVIAFHEMNLLRLGQQDIEPICDLIGTYPDQQVDLADAALLQLAERENISTIFTTDRRHFRLFTQKDGTPFRLLPDDYEG